MEINSKRIGERIGLLALVLSVLFLAYELRQSNNIAQTNTRIEVANSLAEINSSVYTNPEVAQFLLKFSDPDFQPSPAERLRFNFFIGRLSNSWITAENAYQNGLYSEADYQATLDFAKSMVENTPGAHPYFVSYARNLSAQTSSYEVWSLILGIIEDYDAGNP